MPARTKAGRPGGAGTRPLLVPSPVAAQQLVSLVHCPCCCPCCSWVVSLEVSLLLLFRTQGPLSFPEIFSLGNSKVFNTAFNTVLVFIWKQSYPRTHWMTALGAAGKHPCIMSVSFLTREGSLSGYALLTNTLSAALLWFRIFMYHLQDSFPGGWYFWLTFCS